MQKKIVLLNNFIIQTDNIIYFTEKNNYVILL